MPEKEKERVRERILDMQLEREKKVRKIVARWKEKDSQKKLQQEKMEREKECQESLGASGRIKGSNDIN